MKEPMRLRDARGPAAELMRGAALPVPNAARRRALAFTGAAVNMAAGSTALAAGGTSALVKSVALCVGLGVVGGGVASLVVSSTFSALETSPPPAIVAPLKSRAPAPPVEAPPRVLPPEPEPEVVPQPVLPTAEPLVPPSAKPPMPTQSATVPLASRVAPPSRPSLFDEQRMIEKARAAIGRGDAKSGMTTLDEYERTFEKPQFSPEAMALRVEALSHSGQLDRARRLADEFRRRYPRHPLLSRVDASVGR